MHPKTRVWVILSAIISVGFVLMILSCAFSGNWLALTLLVPLCLLLIPLLFLDLAERSDSEAGRALLAMLHALIGAIVVAFYGIPIVAFHADKIETLQFILWLCADLLTTIAVCYFFMKRGGEEW